MLRRGGRTAGLAKTWFANVKERKDLINCAKNKLKVKCHIIAHYTHIFQIAYPKEIVVQLATLDLAAVDIIATKHPSERIMVFTETIESIEKLKEMLQNKGIKSCLLTANRVQKREDAITKKDIAIEFYAFHVTRLIYVG